MPCRGLSLDLVAFNTLVDFHARQGRARATWIWLDVSTVKKDLFAENLLGKLDYSWFRTCQSVSKRFKTFQWCPKPFARWELPRRSWAALYMRSSPGQDGLPVDWTFKGIRLRDWAQLMQRCEVWWKRRSWMIWASGDVPWKLSHLEVLVQIFSRTAQWHRT